MPETPLAVARLDAYLATATIAHEAIADLHDELAARSLSNEGSRRLFREAARIATSEVPKALTEARRLRGLWSEQELLDPTAAADTLRLLSDEIERVEPQLTQMRARLNEIVRELRQLVND